MTNEDKSYNGWTNYETWVVNLWLDGDEGSYRHLRAMAQEAWANAEADRTFTRLERATLDLMAALKDEHEETQPEVTGVWADLMGAALSEVNWHEIASNRMGEVDQSGEAEVQS